MAGTFAIGRKSTTTGATFRRVPCLRCGASCRTSKPPHEVEYLFCFACRHPALWDETHAVAEACRAQVRARMAERPRPRTSEEWAADHAAWVETWEQVTNERMRAIGAAA